MNKLVIYSGRFSPFGKHHFESYRHLCERFGRSNVYIATTSTLDERNPFTFEEKAQIISHFDIPISRIVNVKSPYRCDEITQHFNPFETMLIFGVGSKDNDRLNTTNYMQPFDDKTSKPFINNGYFYQIPHQSINHAGNELSGTYLRSILGSCDENTFSELYGIYDEGLDKIFKTKLTENNAGYITKNQLKRIESYIDSFFKQFNIDINFQDLTKNTHFFQRLNDPRNQTQISQDELRQIFKKISTKYGAALAKLNDGANGVLKDMETDVNIPFMMKWDAQNKELDLIPKTIMRKKDFKSSTPVYAAEALTQNPSKTKHIKHLYEDKSLTFGQLKEILLGLSKNKYQCYEKFDGQNLKVGVRNGQVLAARNKTTTVKPMNREGLVEFFKDKPTIQESFVTAFDAIKEVLDSVPAIKRLMEERNLFLNFEVLNPKTVNVFGYGNPKLVLHNLIEYDDNGTEKGSIPESGFNVYKNLQSTKSGEYSIHPPNPIKFNTDPVMEAMIEFLFKGLPLNENIDNRAISLTDTITYELLNHAENVMAESEPISITEVNDPKFIENKIKLENVISGGKPNRFEGVVFSHNNNIYKVTGSFRYYNQLLGVTRYNK